MSLLMSSAQNAGFSLESTPLSTDLKLYYGTPDLTEFDLVANGFHDGKVTIGYDHPSTFEFSLRVAQHTLPIGRQEFVVFVDPNYGGGMTPIFEGHVAEIDHPESNTVKYRCYDATKRAADEVFVMSAPPSGSGQVPRLLYNEKIDSSPDYPFQRRTDATVRVMAVDILEDAWNALQAIQAAPPASTAYDLNDIALWDFEPQERVEFLNTTVRDAMEQLLDLYPDHKMLFFMGPSHRQWRFYKIAALPSITLTLNDFSDATKLVMSVDLRQSTDKRMTAARIHGPEGSTNATITQSGGGLTKLWTTTEETFLVASGPGAVGDHVGAHWQITDDTKRRMALLLPEKVTVETAGLTSSSGSGVVGLSFARTQRPQLLATYDNGTTWEPIHGWQSGSDWLRGIIRAPYPVFKVIDGDRTLPDDIKFYYAYKSAPLSVRYPEAGFSGTAYTVAGIEAVLERYDEMLAVGYEHGTPVTSAARVAEFAKLARELQEASRDLIYSGGLTLFGHQYDWHKLGRRVNLAAVDQYGDPVVTGWEAINAWVTGVEYDYPGAQPQGLTTLTFSNDQRELELGFEELKERLKIRPYQTAIVGGHSLIAGFNPVTSVNTLTLVNREQFVHFQVPDFVEQTVF